MIEKICSHCGATLLVGLRYCPGCLRAIESRQLEATPTATEGPEVHDSFGRDLKTLWATFIFKIQSTWGYLLGRAQPKEPPKIDLYSRGNEDRFAFRPPKVPASMSLSVAYTRIVCPKCQCVQRETPDLLPSDLIKCRSCDHQFPGSFAPELRKGADLECFKCGVTTFCVTGLTDPICPNCRYKGDMAEDKTRLKSAALAFVTALVFLAFLSHAVITKTTTQFLVGFTVISVASALGFVTMVALGF